MSKRNIGWSTGETMSNLSVVFSQWNFMTELHSPSKDVWQHVWIIVNQRGLLNSVSTSSVGRGHQSGWLSYSVSEPSRSQTDSVVQDPGEQKWMFTINHIVSINCVVWLNASDIKRHFILQGHRGNIPGASKRASPLSEYAGLEYPRPAELHGIAQVYANAQGSEIWVELSGRGLETGSIDQKDVETWE